MSPSSPRSRYVAEVDPDGRVADPLHDGPALASGAPPGAIVRVETEAGRPPSVEVLAPAGSALARSYRLGLEHGLDPVHPPDVMAETAALLDAPGLDDPRLTDLRALPFVSIDGPGTRDLDQALFVSRDRGGYIVRYALADASYYVRPGTALFEEAMTRGASYYLPGLSIPMLPRALSEGLVSLNPGVDRRAAVFVMHLDPRGLCIKTELVRGLIRSRAQLTFERVQDYLDDPSGHALGDAGIEESLRLLREVGEHRLDDAAEREIAFYRRAEVQVKVPDHEAMSFRVVAELRNAVELYGEQLSLMCNVEGARLLRDGDTDEDPVQPIYRVHAPPKPERVEKLERMLAGAARLHGVDPARWAWARERGPSLSRFLASLPTAGPQAGLARAIQRQAIMINVRSTFSPEPGAHHGVGADVYARFSAPMREIVGVFLHKEAWEKLGEAPAGGDDEALRERIVTRANESKALQRELTRAANLLVLDEVFGREATGAAVSRPARRGTLLGITRTKLHVHLDDPPVDVKVYERHFEGGWEVDPAGASIERRGRVLRLGDPVELITDGRDERGRWRLLLAE